MSACAAMRGLSPVLALSDSGLGVFFNLSTSNKSNDKSQNGMEQSGGESLLKQRQEKEREKT